MKQTKEQMFYNFVSKEMINEGEVPPPYEEHIKAITDPESGSYSLHNAIMTMMEEYAKQTSIAFAEWVKENYYMDNEGFYHHDYQNKIHYTVENLFELFTKSLN